MAKGERILNLFPAFYAAADRHKLLYEVVHKLARPMEEADTHIFRIQRAHRLKVAGHAEDIIRLGGLLNLTPFHFEDILNNENINYDKKLDMMRERVQRIAAVHLKGLGTPWAVMEATAIFLNATIVSGPVDDLLIKHIDEEKFSHKAVIKFTHQDNEPKERIYLHENPLRRRKMDLSGKWPMNYWRIDNHNVQASPLRLVIQGVGDRTVLPSIFCPDTRKGMVFNGLVPDGKTLVVDEINGSLLDNQPVDEWVIYFEGGISDFSFNDNANFVCEKGSEAGPFGGDVEQIVYSPYRKKIPAVTTTVGKSEWRFNVAEGVYDGNDFDFSVYATDHKPIGEYDGDYNFDNCVFDFPPSGIVGMAWQERIPCSFKIVLPSKIDAKSGLSVDEEKEGRHLNHVSRIGNILTRFKAAGIRAYVDTAKDAWILGESIIGSEKEAGDDDTAFRTTTLRDEKAELFVN